MQLCNTAQPGKGTALPILSAVSKQIMQNLLVAVALPAAVMFCTSCLLRANQNQNLLQGNLSCNYQPLLAEQWYHQQNAEILNPERLADHTSEMWHCAEKYRQGHKLKIPRIADTCVQQQNAQSHV